MPRLLFALPLIALALLTACTPDEQAAQHSALARWEDARLAAPDSLAAMIAGPDAVIRRDALRTAGRIGRTDVLPAMIAALDDGSQAVRAQAAFSLGLLGRDVAVAPLMQALNDPHLAVRVAALEGLAHQDHDGANLLRFATGGVEREAVAAWTALRNVAAQADPDSLVAAIRTGLARPEPAVRWRVLRCAERAPDSTLVAQIAPYAIDSEVDVRVHALRALGRHAGEAAVEAVLQSAARRGRLRGQDLRRIEVAELRALGNLAGPILAADPEGDHASLAGRLTAVINKGAANVDNQVAEVALQAMSTAVGALPLPDEATRQESLLPVWRLRMVRAAREQLIAPAPAVRGTACRALAAVRGRGARDALVPLLDDPEPTVAADAVAALGQLHLLEICLGAESLYVPESIAETVALVTAIAEDEELLDDPQLPHLAYPYLEIWLTHPDFTVRWAACSLAARFHGGLALGLLVQAYHTATDLSEGQGDVQLGAIAAVEEQLTDAAAGATPFQFRQPDAQALVRMFPDVSGLPDSLQAVSITDRHRRAAATMLQTAFDDPDVRVRLAARECAVTTALLSPQLIPPEASLRVTLPAVIRTSTQPALREAFDAPEVRIITDRGEFTIALDGRTAPNTCATFLHLAANGLHDGLTFHRVVPDFVIQGGCPRGDGSGGPGWTIRSEWSRLPYQRGAVGIAHSGKDTGGCQWFVCHSDQPHLNGRYTVFGHVTSGMAVVDAIERGDAYRVEVINAE